MAKRYSSPSISSVFLGISLLSSLILTACVAQPTSTPAPAPTAMIDTPAPTTAPPTIVPKDLSQVRPYTDNSIWNTPIGPSPRYDPNSALMVETIGLDSHGQITSNPLSYSYTLYFVDGSTPRWDIPCTRYKCTIYTPDKSTKTDVLHDVPLPPDAVPASGTDNQMIVIDQTNFAEYNLWGVERTATGWTVNNASSYNIQWDGMPAAYGSRGAGVPYYAGLIRPWEILQGHIDHVIAFAYPYPAQGRCVFPASKTDGNSALPYAIPEGARLQLDPSLTEDDFSNMGLDRTGKIIARALQKYGMILINYAGRPKINIENLVDNPHATIQWSDPRLILTTTTISSIPYTKFHVIALPDGYWNAAADGPMHGKCYAYPDGDLAP